VGEPLIVISPPIATVDAALNAGLRPAGRVPTTPPVVHLQLFTVEYSSAGSQLKLKVSGADTEAGTLIAFAAVGDVLGRNRRSEDHRAIISEEGV
jgi:hypothetical protein